MPEKALRDEAQRLRDIIDISKMVVSTLELDTLLDRILHSARDLVKVPAGSIALIDDVRKTMTLHASHGLSDSFTARDSWQVEEGGLTSKILEQQDLFIVEDTSCALFFNNPLAINEGIRAIIAIPLKVQDSTVGILYLNDFTPRKFEKSVYEQLSIFASFAALSIDNARLHEKTLRLASTDGLTGLFNHRQFKRALFQEVVRTQRYDTDLSMIMFDIDDFKQFNDRYGHPCGDRILIRVAELLRDIFREVDLVFRYGGEEFVVLMPQSRPEDALVAAERARDAIACMRIACHEVDHPLGVTVSAGVASLPHDADSEEGLLRVADQLMYQAKHQGKNQVHTPESVRND